jgi:ABC-type bacteriocin/lantibiotic exporter with double-glycine peptidase domain
VDEVLVAHMDGVALPLLTGLVIAAIARSALLYVQAQVLMDTFGRAARTAAKRFLAQALALPMTFYSQRSSGEIAARVDLNERVAETISRDLATLALEFLNETFGYARGDAPLIEGFSLTLKPGGRVALVGASGSGKSTIARLAAGLYHPWSGEILFDGKPRDVYERPHLAAAVAYVDQDVALFEGSVRDNLTLWEAAPDAAVEAAIRDAAIDTEVLRERGGLDAPLQEGARNLSGGQRQRLEIARALVRNPALLILDEATSALDPTSEALVESNLRKRSVTCLVVAHRLSTVRDADEILVLERGRVVERGRHDELLARPGGRYAVLVASEASD